MSRLLVLHVFLVVACLASSTWSCDLSIGEWVRDENASRLPYDPKACSAQHLDNVLACRSKRNQDYMNWRWQPTGCNFPPFNVAYVSRRLQGVRMLMVGDSLMKNHFNTAVCMLTAMFGGNATLHTKRSSTGARLYRYIQISHLDAQIVEITSVFLCPEKRPGEIVDCSSPDPAWYSMLNASNVAVFTTGHWWGTSSSNGTQPIFYNREPALTNFTQERYVPWSPWPALQSRIWRNEVFLHRDFRRTLFRQGRIGHLLALKMLVEYTRNYTGQLVYQTTSPTHFWGGHSRNGSCDQWNGPWKTDNESYWMDRFFQAYVREVDVFRPLFPKWRVLDVTRMTKLRPDAHPSTSMHDRFTTSKLREDCSHFCLGTVDEWFHMLVATLRPKRRVG